MDTAKKIILSIAIAITILLSGCGPYYATRFSYKLPKNRSDRHCVAKCRIGLSNCQNSCRQTNQICQNQQLVAEDIASRRRRRNGYDNFYPAADCQQSCGCRRAYNECYRDCGGKVITERVCVYNCPGQ